MVKFSELFQEEFLTGEKIRGSYYEIFVNPTKEEVRDLGDSYRVIIDAKEKRIYVTDSDLLHYDMARIIKGEGYLSGFNYDDYWKRGKGVDRIITMNIDGMEYYSDSLTDIILKTRDTEQGDEIKSQIDLLVNGDFSWIKGRWFDHSMFQKGLDEVREML